MQTNIKRSAAIEAHLPEEAFPFFSLLRRGADSGRKNSTEGNFAFHLTKNGTYYHTGSIMPIKRMDDDGLKQILLNAIAFLKTLPCESDLAKARTMLQKHLDDNGLSMLRVEDWNDLKGWVAFSLTETFFETILPELKYVSALEIQNERASIYEMKKAFWKHPGDVMFWMYGWPKKDREFQEIPLLYLVFEPIDQVHIASRQWSSRDLINLPVDLSEFFTVNEDAKLSSISVYFSETRSGWSNMELTLDDHQFIIKCSNVYDPFFELLVFARSIENNDLPMQINIDEEGTDKRFTAYQTDHKDKIYFILSNPNAENDQQLFHGIFEKKVIVHAFKRGLKDFFETRYIPSEWEWDVDDECKNFQERVLNDPWINS
jgi:hypothetical protein